MSTEIDSMFSALPVEAQSVCMARWKGAMSIVADRRGPPDPERQAGTEEIVKLFFILGYSAALEAEKTRIEHVKTLIANFRGA